MAPVCLAFKEFHQHPLVASSRQGPTGGTNYIVAMVLFCNMSGDTLDIPLHSFCDASTPAYAEVGYLVVTSKVGISMQLVAVKTLVASMTQQTVRHLVLLAALARHIIIVLRAQLLHRFIPQSPIGFP